jgi:hypothetical protein
MVRESNLVRRIGNGSVKPFPALPQIWATEVSSRELALARNLEDEMKLPRRQFLHLAAGAAALPVVSQIATAQTYVRIV